jgi:hypothetical protein
MMMTLRFNDGVTFDTSGPLRKERRHDGWYVVGGGMLMAMDSEGEADDFVKVHAGVPTHGAGYSAYPPGTYPKDGALRGGLSKRASKYLRKTRGE